MNKLLPILFMLLFLYSFLMERPFMKRNVVEVALHQGSNADTPVPPLVLRTSLEDSIPVDMLSGIGLKNVHGTKLKFHNGHFASYFEYQANHQDVLPMLSSLPVPFSSVLADTTYRRIPAGDLASLMKAVPAQEMEAFPDFWSASADAAEVIECIKPPFRHILLIDRDSDRIFHRVCPV